MGIVRVCDLEKHTSLTVYRSAFGGMIAFCIIVGDSIPHVMTALFPSLPDRPFLWLLADRRAVIVIFILGVSYPLSLYRDIAKVLSFPTLRSPQLLADTHSWQKHLHLL